MELVALVSKGEGSWAQVAGLIKYSNWEKVIVLGDDFAKDNFKPGKEIEFIRVDLGQKIKDLRDDLSKKLKGKFDGLEVAVTIASGDGKEHMALISALINLPVGVRFAALTKEGILDL